MSQPILCGVLTLTPTHCGTGQAAGAIDLPIAREVHTGLPVLPASTIKGVVRDWFGQPEEGSDRYDAVVDVFGPPPPRRAGRGRDDGDDKDGEDTEAGPDDEARGGGEPEPQPVSLQAGNVVFLEGMLLAFPVRALTGVYRLVTAPMLIRRLQRTLKALGVPNVDTFTCPTPPNAGALLPSNASGPLGLEDRVFTADRCESNAEVDALAEKLGRFIAEEAGRQELQERIVVVGDEDLQDLARRGTAVTARIVLDPEHKTSDNLWYEETLPPDTLFAVVMADRPGSRGDPTDRLRALLRKTLPPDEQQASPPFTRHGQIGGNVTVGQGLVCWTLDVEVPR